MFTEKTLTLLLLLPLRRRFSFSLLLPLFIAKRESKHGNVGDQKIFPSPPPPKSGFFLPSPLSLPLNSTEPRGERSPSASPFSFFRHSPLSLFSFFFPLRFLFGGFTWKHEDLIRPPFQFFPFPPPFAGFQDGDNLFSPLPNPPPLFLEKQGIQRQKDFG